MYTYTCTCLKVDHTHCLITRWSNSIITCVTLCTGKLHAGYVSVFVWEVRTVVEVKGKKLKTCLTVLFINFQCLPNNVVCFYSLLGCLVKWQWLLSIAVVCETVIGSSPVTTWVFWPLQHYMVAGLVPFREYPRGIPPASGKCYVNTLSELAPNYKCTNQCPGELSQVWASPTLMSYGLVIGMQFLCASKCLLAWTICTLAKNFFCLTEVYNDVTLALSLLCAISVAKKETWATTHLNRPREANEARLATWR